MANADVNYMAVLVSAIISMFLGFLWYGPLFGKLWIKLSNMSKLDMQKAKSRGMGKSYFITFVGSLVMAWVLAYIVDYAEAASVVNGAMVGFWVWLGFLATKSLGMIFWENKPVKLYILNNAYDLVYLLIAGALLAVWV